MKEFKCSHCQSYFGSMMGLMQHIKHSHPYVFEKQISVTFKIPKELNEQINHMVDRGFSHSRSEFVRHALLHLLEQEYYKK